jgi:hypothetical protein
MRDGKIATQRITSRLWIVADGALSVTQPIPPRVA